MKKIFISALLSLLFVSGVFAQKEGTCTMVMESATNKLYNRNIDLFIKPGKVLMQTNVAEMGGMTMNMILDSKANAMFMLMDAGGEKNAFKMPFPKPEDLKGKVKAPVITDTKETRVIEGYNCHKLLVKTDQASSEVWVTNDVDFSFDAISTALSQGAKDASMPTGYKGFPIQIITMKGTDKVTMTFKNIKKGPVNDSLFDLTGYKLTEMPSGLH